MNVLDRLRELSRASSERTYYIDVPRGRTYSYQQFHSLAASLGKRLRSAGLTRGQRVGILLINSAEFAALYWACLYEGLVAVPVTPTLGTRDIHYALQTARISLLVYSDATRDVCPPPQSFAEPPAYLRLRCAEDSSPCPAGHLEWAESELNPGQISGNLLDGVRRDDLFVITFTSGTTSRPKGVCHTVGSLFGAALAFNEANQVGPEHRYYHVLTMSYMAGLLNTLLCPYMAGGTTAVAQPYGPMSALRFWDTVIRYGLNTLWLVPTICSSLLRLDRSDEGRAYCREHVRLACVGTAPLPRRLQRDFEERYGTPLLESYGLSELLFVAANIPGGVGKPGSVGQLLQGVEARYESEAESQPAADGEIWVRTPYLMAGYLDPESGEPDRLPRDTWFATGDLGKQDTDGDLFITNRKKDIIIRGGVNLSPRSIEEVLLEHPAVQEAAVVGVPHEFYGEDAVAVLKLKPGHVFPAVKDSLTALCKQSLGAMAIPSRFVEMTELPKNTTGKVIKTELRTRLASGTVERRSA
jgi:long-chain acyl-CoA synthetase